jgi:hypothetical protein
VATSLPLWAVVLIGIGGALIALPFITYAVRRSRNAEIVHTESGVAGDSQHHSGGGDNYLQKNVHGPNVVKRSK